MKAMTVVPALAIEPVAKLPVAAIVNVILAGVAAALHVGKAAIALPQLREEFDRSLAALSWVVSVFPLIGVAGGMLAGVLVRRWGDRRVLGLGLGVLASASAAGAAAPSFGWLVGTRLVEGLGFLLVVVAAPAILHRLTPLHSQPRVFGVWSTFMAGGMAISLGAGPLLGGWRPLWLADAGLALLAAACLPLTMPVLRAAARGGCLGEAFEGVRGVLRARPVVLLALAFAAYTLQFTAVLTFLPVFLIQRIGVSVGVAGAISAVVVAANILGNVSAGPLRTRGLRPSIVLAGSSVVMAAAGIGMFLPAMPAFAAVLLCLVFSAVGGLLPATVLGCAPAAAPAPGLAPLSLGLVMQGNYLGQVLGPILISAVVGVAGWSAAALPVAVAGVLGAGFGLAFGRCAGDRSP